MLGKYTIEVKSKKLSYKLEIKRKITILRGDSGTGKTTLIRMIMLARRKNSPYEVNCEKQCLAFTNDSLVEMNDISKYSNSILFFDEDIDFIQTKEFARIVKYSDCYFVIATRENLATLPYSCKEIYELQGNLCVSNNEEIFVNDLKGLHSFSPKVPVNLSHTLSCIIIEDKKAGYTFFGNLANSLGIDCISANGNSNVTNVYLERLEENKDTGILIIVDSAAYGAYYESLLLAIKGFSNTVIYLPESFEYLILKSGIIESLGLQDKIENTYDYAESSIYFSWERYYTILLTEITKDTLFAYNKSELNPIFLKRDNVKQIRSIIPEGIKIGKDFIST